MPQPSTLPYYKTPHFNAEINAAREAAAELQGQQMKEPKLRRPCWRADYYHPLHTPQGRGYISGWVAWDADAGAMMFYPDVAIAIDYFKNAEIRLQLPGARLALLGGNVQCTVAA